MRNSFKFAVENVSRHGDTDVFPFPFENRIFSDLADQTVDLLEQYHANFEGWLHQYAPANEPALAPVSYVGFRWATQIDPIWNLYFLALVHSIGPEIEKARISKEKQAIFSYRFSPDGTSFDMFDRSVGWRQFIERSVELAKSRKIIVICDVSEFYPRINHHRLDSALDQLQLTGDVPSRIAKFLSFLSGTYSFGLPIGGPAARLLSELVLNQIDRLLAQHGITFCRFADDYHLFCDSIEEAYASLIFLSEKLFLNQGLLLQKSKTRIMRAAEFIATSPLAGMTDPADEDATSPEAGALPASPFPTQDGDLGAQARNLLRFSIRFDPYSVTAEEDYEQLKAQLAKFDIVGLLRSELTKSRIHSALARKVTSAIRFLDQQQRDGAILSLIENAELVYPIWPSVMTLLRSTLELLSDTMQKKIVDVLSQLINRRSHLMGPDLNLAFTLRVLALVNSPEVQDLFAQVHRDRPAPLVRREIVVSMARWRNWSWLSDLRTRFRTLSPWERRAFIAASFVLQDEGQHWRQHTKQEFSPFEKLVVTWAAAKKQQNPYWVLPS